jgi:hypothetical protein
MMKAGFDGIALISSTVRASVPATSGLASALNPTWVSLTCTNNGVPLWWRLSVATAAVARLIGVSTPADRTNNVPALPAARHFNASRRD